MYKRFSAIVNIRFVLILFLFIPLAGICQLHADFLATPLSGCPPMVINFKDITTGNPTLWKWDFGNGTTSDIQNPNATYTNPGIYNIKLLVKNQFGEDSAIKKQYINVNALPVAAFDASETAGCFPFKAAFADRSLAGSGTITAWEWDFGDGDVSAEQNPVHTYTFAGKFKVILKVTNSNGCVKVISKPAYIKLENGVKADFGYSSAGGCGVPAPVTFNNKSVGTGQVTYAWDFGDGNTSAGQNPYNIYQNAGVYTVKLIATNSYGCSDTMTKPGAINIGLVKADFTKQDVACAGAGFQLTNTSDPSSFVSALWDFGDGTSSNEANPSKLYAQPGTYQVKIITDFGSCKDSITKAVTVIPKPAADFTANNNNSCSAPLNVTFNNTANNAVAYEWDFGDGATSALQNPAHTYLSSGSYPVTLTAINASGCRDTIVKQSFVNIIPPKIISLGNFPVKNCLPVTINPVALLQDSVRPDAYLWNFGDGTTSTSAAPAHTYTVAGSYDLKLTITVAGCTDSLKIINAAEAGNKPKAAFEADLRSICASATANFKDRSTGATGTKWLWFFGDGSYAADQNTTHQYTDSGYFKVSLVITNYGCSDTIEKKKYIYVKPPIAKFDTAFSCSSPLKRAFIDKSAGAKSHAWNFGDSTNSIQKDPFHTYAIPGSYLVTLTVSNGDCKDTISKNVVVIKEQGNVEVSNAVSCINTAINFAVTNINPVNISSYTWYFNGIGQPAAAAVVNPVAGLYATAGL